MVSSVQPCDFASPVLSAKKGYGGVMCLRTRAGCHVVACLRRPHTVTIPRIGALQSRQIKQSCVYLFFLADLRSSGRYGGTDGATHLHEPSLVVGCTPYTTSEPTIRSAGDLSEPMDRACLNEKNPVR